MTKDEKLSAAKMWSTGADELWIGAQRQETAKDKNYDKLRAMAAAIDGATNLFQFHELKIPEPLRVLRRDLYEAMRGSSPDYFRNNLVRLRTKGRAEKGGTRSTLHCHAALAVDLLLQADFGSLEQCCRRVAEMLRKRGVPIEGKADQSWKTVKSWRVELIRNGKNPGEDGSAEYFYTMYLNNLMICGNADKFPEVPEWWKKFYGGSFLKDNSPPKTPEELVKKAEEQIDKFVKGWPNILSPPDELEELV